MKSNMQSCKIAKASQKDMKKYRNEAIEKKFRFWRCTWKSFHLNESQFIYLLSAKTVQQRNKNFNFKLNKLMANMSLINNTKWHFRAKAKLIQVLDPNWYNCQQCQATNKPGRSSHCTSSTFGVPIIASIFESFLNNFTRLSIARVHEIQATFGKSPKSPE